MADVKGLPEGLEVVRFGAAGEEEFELIGGTIIKGVRPNAASGVIVKPAAGYTFQPARTFDIRAYAFVDGPPNEYAVVKSIDPATIKVTAEFVVTNAVDGATVREALGRLSNLPGSGQVTIE